jgi:ABC-type lipoprotein export system ATPase subunit/bifunctional DNA-binding transcriptional regulator/antitoxin component of YhaV-PrlF toxin-antitoxin module
MEQQPIIICDNLVKIYKLLDLEVVALQGLDFVARPGEFVAIVGASGSGKSTLMSMIGGLDRPTSGWVHVAEHELTKMNERELNDYRQREIGFIWQHATRNLLPYLSARENIRLPLLIGGSISNEKEAYIAHLLDLVELGERADHRLSELSGGEQQRVALCVALVNHPQILLADEPTGELDSHLAKQMFDILRRLQEDLNLTIVVVSHDIEIARYVDRVVTIRDGRVATETLKQKNSLATVADNEQTLEEEHVYEELGIFDSAGSIHIPDQYREKLGIQRRARIELTDTAIIIHPVENDDNTTMETIQQIRDQKTDAQVETQGNVLERIYQRLKRKHDTDKVEGSQEK